MTAFQIPAAQGASEITEKRSRFLGHLFPAETEEEAKARIREIRKQYHDARHNCWCYRIHGETERFSDDGEPQGSAGMPMLEVFRHEEVYNFVCVVTRYFGGVLLGTGGLSRAYGAAAKEALLDAGTVSVGQRRALCFSCPYAMAERLKAAVLAAGAELGDLRYGEDVRFTVWISEDRAQELADQILDLSGGKTRAVLSDTYERRPTS